MGAHRQVIGAEGKMSAPKIRNPEECRAAARFAVLVNPDVPRTAASVTAYAQATASTIGWQIEVFTASTTGEIDAAFASMVQKQADAVLVGTNVFFSNSRVQFATLAARHALPAIYFAREFVE